MTHARCLRDHSRFRSGPRSRPQAIRAIRPGPVLARSPTSSWQTSRLDDWNPIGKVVLAVSHAGRLPGVESSQWRFAPLIRAPA
jgi:hypothetical protein